MARVVVLLSLWIAGCAGMPENMRAPALPKNVSVPAGHRHAMTMKAAGSLNYECRLHPGMSGAYGWVLDSPDATLMHWSGFGVGRYYAGPTWAHRDGSRVTGKLVAASPARPGELPIHLYRAAPAGDKGEFSDVSYIQRLNAKGAEPPARCDAAAVGRGRSVEFSADFLFYKPR